MASFPMARLPDGKVTGYPINPDGQFRDIPLRLPGSEECYSESVRYLFNILYLNAVHCVVPETHKGLFNPLWVSGCTYCKVRNSRQLNNVLTFKKLSILLTTSYHMLKDFNSLFTRELKHRRF